jgi:hypothetical protein
VHGLPETMINGMSEKEEVDYLSEFANLLSAGGTA